MPQTYRVRTIRKGGFYGTLTYPGHSSFPSNRLVQILRQHPLVFYFLELSTEL